MTSSERIENATAMVAILGIAFSQAMPRWAWMDDAIPIAMLIGLGWAFAVRIPEDRQRAKRGLWVVPTVASLMAAQWLYFAEPTDRLRAGLLGVGLVASASALAWIRRRQ